MAGENKDENILFTKFKNMIDDLHECIGNSHKGLSSYHTILQNMKLPEHIKIQENVIKTYILENKESIIKQDRNKLKDLKYPDKPSIKIEFSNILRSMKSEDRSAVWQHLFVILHYIEPSNEEITKVFKKYINNKTPEENLIHQMIGDVTNNLSPEQMADPSSAMLSLLSSGKMADMMSKINDSKTSQKALLGTLRTFIEDLENEADE